MNDRSSSKCDVVVIGGGPSGATISALLAEKGWDVVVLEKAKHPRFHIGESLLPHTLPLLERLGVLQDVEKIGLKKYGGEVISSYHNKCLTFYFSNALDKSHPYAFQVRRSEFDEILLRNCTSKGAKVHEGFEVTGVEFRENKSSLIQGINALGNIHFWDARYLVDATGRSSFLSKLLNIKRRNSHHNSVAIFSHFKGVERLKGKDEGNISISWFDHGWFWVIPFKDGITSVGAVCWPSYLKTRNTDLDKFLWSTISLCTPIAQRLKSAQLTMPTMVAGNYSYQASRMVGPGYIIVGDGYAFIDPVFSSGVHLAINSATLGAEVVDAYLSNSPSFKNVRLHFERTVRKGINTFSWFIYRFTQPAFQDLFMFPRNIFRIEEAILSVLSGDVFKNNFTIFRIFLFKVLYYIVFLLSPRRNFTFFRQKKRCMKASFLNEP